MEEDLSTQIRIQKEILKWVRILARKEVKNMLEEVLSDDTKKLVYHYSDGNRGTRDFKEIANVKSTATISVYWREWASQGIVELRPVQGGERAKKLFNLEEFGIEVPAARKPDNSQINSASTPVEINETQNS